MSWSSDEYDANLRSILALFLEYSDFEGGRLRVRSCSELCQHAKYIESFKFTFVTQKVRVSAKPLELNLRGSNWQHHMYDVLEKG
jgi:hypothetical protein